MIQIVRKVHLYSGLVFFVFILLYFLSGYVIVHHLAWGDMNAEQSIHTAAIENPLNLNEGGVSEYLLKRFGFSGRPLRPQQMNDGRWKYSFVHPGHTDEVFISSERDIVEIVSRDWGARAAFVQFHRLFGYEGGWAYGVWALMLDLVSLTMIVFPLSGIVIWYRLTRRRFLGWTLLSLNFGYLLYTILYLLYVR